MRGFLSNIRAVGRGVIPVKEKPKSFLIPVIISIAFILVLMIALLLLPEEGEHKALKAVITGLMWGGVYALIALGVVVVYKASMVFNLAHGGILLFLTYFLWWLFAPVRMGLPLGVAIIIVVLSGSLLGLIVYRTLMRPMIGRSPLATFLMTLVLGFSVLQGVTILAFGGQSVNMPEIFPAGGIELGGVDVSYKLIFAFVTATVMFLAFVYYFRYTRGGLAMRCVSEDNVVSQSLGINVKRIYAIAWVVGCLSAAIGGVLLASLTAVYSERGGIGAFAIMRALPVLLLGGLESIPGAYFGAIIIGLTEHLTAAYVDPLVPGFRVVLPYILMVVILLIKPHGLFGLRGIKRI